MNNKDLPTILPSSESVAEAFPFPSATDSTFYSALGALVLPRIEETVMFWKGLSQGELDEWKRQD